MTVIAIDGPAGSGKSTIAAALAARLGLPHVDTGAFYRAAALAVLRAGADPDDPQACADAVRGIRITRADGRTLLDGEDVEDEIRGAEVTAAVSAVSRHREVRRLLLSAQQEQIGPGGAVVEGRDAGTVVVPAAALKVWLTARPGVRAARRAAQWGQSGGEALADHERWLADRDASDAPNMALAADAVRVDTSERAVDAIVDEIVAHLLGPVAPGPAESRPEPR